MKKTKSKKQHEEMVGLIESLCSIMETNGFHYFIVAGKSCNIRP